MFRLMQPTLAVFCRFVVLMKSSLSWGPGKSPRTLRDSILAMRHSTESVRSHSKSEVWRNGRELRTRCREHVFEDEMGSTNRYWRSMITTSSRRRMQPYTSPNKRWNPNRQGRPSNDERLRDRARVVSERILISLSFSHFDLIMY